MPTYRIEVVETYSLTEEEFWRAYVSEWRRLIYEVEAASAEEARNTYHARGILISDVVDDREVVDSECIDVGEVLDSELEEEEVLRVETLEEIAERERVEQENLFEWQRVSATLRPYVSSGRVIRTSVPVGPTGDPTWQL